MKILFLTLLDFDNIKEQGIYSDLIRSFMSHGHDMYVISPREKRKQLPEELFKVDNCQILKLQIGNMQKTNILEKGISTLTLEKKFVNSIKKYFSEIKFDLVLYSTPPITLQKAVSYVEKRDGAATYLLLKDIFPQNALDLGMLKKTGVKGFLYRYFRQKEIKLYAASDYIGCMSKANVDFVLEHNTSIDASKVEVCPNSIKPLDLHIETEEKDAIKFKYGIPTDKTIFVYGGNLGKPQGVDFLIECLEYTKDYTEAYFLIVGSGTEYSKLDDYFKKKKPNNARLISQLPKLDYELLVNVCDVGLIFLDRRFTIPNFPSRLLSYMQASMPVIAVTDRNTDIGKVIEENQFGYWCESTDAHEFGIKVKLLCSKELQKQMGTRSRRYLEGNYTAEHSYEVIVRHFE